MDDELHRLPARRRQGAGEPSDRESPRTGAGSRSPPDTSLTGYDNRDAKTGQPDSEVYLYDAETGRLACASCNPSGARPTGSSEVPGHEFQRRGFEPTSRVLFDTGRLFFDSADALVPQDTNGNTDVYEYEPAGCRRLHADEHHVQHDHRRLCRADLLRCRLRPESEFLDASATGADAFFTTRERLVPQDVDGLLDIYDAHECTASSPCAPPTEPRRKNATRRRPAGPPPSRSRRSSGRLPARCSAASATWSPNPRRNTSPRVGGHLIMPKSSPKHSRPAAIKYKHQRKRRATCEKHAHKAYGAAKQANKQIRPRQPEDRTMIPRSYRTIGGAAVLLAVSVGLLFSASSALAAAPWWGLTSESWPTNLHSGVARDEVQELTVSATGGDFALAMSEEVVGTRY